MLFRSLQSGQSVTITGLPDGTQYSVTELNPGEYTVTYDHPSGTIAEGTIVTATVYNAKSSNPPDPGEDDNDPTGNLTISKTVQGDVSRT